MPGNQGSWRVDCIIFEESQWDDLNPSLLPPLSKALWSQLVLLVLSEIPYFHLFIHLSINLTKTSRVPISCGELCQVAGWVQSIWKAWSLSSLTVTILHPRCLSWYLWLKVIICASVAVVARTVWNEVKHLMQSLTCRMFSINFTAGIISVFPFIKWNLSYPTWLHVRALISTVL